MTDLHAGAAPRLFEGWRRRRNKIAARRRAIAELEGLDDSVLQDIGVNRRSIAELVDTRLQENTEVEAADPRPGFAARPCAQPC